MLAPPSVKLCASVQNVLPQNVVVLRIQESRAVEYAAAVREGELRQLAENYQRWANFSERELAKIGVRVNADGTMTNIRAESAEAQLRECEQERDEYKAEWEALAQEEVKGA